MSFSVSALFTLITGALVFTLAASPHQAPPPPESRMTSTLVNMSLAGLKEQLLTLYGIKDTSDCLEKDDLVKKLANAIDTLPITRGLRYGALKVVGNTKKPTAIVTLSHGLGDSCEGWVDVAQQFSQLHPHILYLVPTAPERSITINGGSVMNGWYDIHGFDRGAAQDVAVLHSAEYVSSLAATYAKKYAVDPTRIAYAGFSQGAAISIACGLTAAVPPAGVVMMSGYLASDKHVLPAARNLDFPLLMCHGTQDPLIQLSMAKVSKQSLEAVGLKNIEFNEYPMQHTAIPREINDVAKFISKILP